MNNPPWRLLTGPPQNAALNMAIDEAIALAFSEGKSPSTLRFYRWRSPCFSIGAFQKLDQHWIEALEKHDLPIVRRFTGGRGILHDNELTYSIVSDTLNPIFSNNIKNTFHTIARGIIAGLNPLGLQTLEISQNRPLKTAAKNPLCFDAVSWHEITTHGKKLIGSAQRRWPKHFLQHGSLILKHSQIVKKSGHETGFPLVSKNQITLSELMAELPSYDNLAQNLTDGFEQILGVDILPGKISAYEQDLIEKLVHKKYGNKNWTLHRKTPKDL